MITITDTDAIVRTLVDRLAIMRDIWTSRELEVQANPSSRKAKAEMNEARLRYLGACRLASDVVNEMTGKNYSPFGMEMRLTDLAIREGLKPISPFSKTQDRQEHAARRDAMVDAFTAEIVAEKD